MNENEFDRTARAWLEEGPTRMSDRAVLSALEEIHTTRRRRRLVAGAEGNSCEHVLRAAIAAVLVVGVGLVAINVLPRGSDGPAVGGQHIASPSPSASAPPSPAQSAAVLPELTQTFVSPTNGFSIGYSDDAEIQPATEVWDPSVAQEDNPEFDSFIANVGVFRGSSAEVPDRGVDG